MSDDAIEISQEAKELITRNYYDCLARKRNDTFNQLNGNAH